MEFAHKLIAVLRGVTESLEKRGFEYCLAGGWAAGAWGLPRATEDIDILLLVEEKEKSAVLECIRGSVVIALSHTHVVRFKGIALWRNLVKVNGGEEPVILDFIIADSDYLRMAVKRSVLIDLYGFQLRMIAAEDLILMKLLSNRPQDRLDIEGILAAGRKIDSGYIRENASGLGIDLDLTFLP